MVFACSGAADVGEIADRAARQLSREGVAAMSCIAGVSAVVEPIMVAAATAPALLAIDGCPQDCVARTLQDAGLESFHHLRLCDLGMNKKESPATQDRVDRVVDAAKEALNG